MELEVLFGPAEFADLPAQDLRGVGCVVFDVLRATSTMVTALGNGAREVRPVATIEEALAERGRDHGVLLAGERGGLRIGPDQACGVGFDLGNSPREFTAERVAGRTVVMTTTNGTRALRACAGAHWVIAGAFLNLAPVVARLRSCGLGRVVLVGSGTGEEPALEDVLAAGACVEELAADAVLADSARIALGAWRAAQPDFTTTARSARNARRLLGLPELAPDVELCFRRNVSETVPVMDAAGALRASFRASTAGWAGG